MTRKKRLGIFLPIRQDNHLHIDYYNTSVPVGCFRADIHTPLLKRLHSRDDIELIEGLNFREALIQNGKVWCGNTCLNDLDRFFWYCEVDRRGGSFDMEVLRTLAREVEVIRDPDKFEVGLDKFRAHQCLLDAGVKVADFALFDYQVPARMTDLLNTWGAAVLKPRRGGWGKGVSLIDSPEKLRDAVGYVRSIARSSPDQGFFLERYYDNDPTRWASLTVVNGKVVYGYRKLAHKFHDFGDGRLKVEDVGEVGGGVALADLVPAHLEEAHKAYEAMGLGLIGFDMIWTNEGPIIVDENTSPGNYIDLYKEVGIDPAEIFAEWVVG